MKLGSARNDPAREPVRSHLLPFGDDRMILAPVLVSWHDDDPATPRAELLFDVVDGRLACTAVTVYAAEATAVVTASALRKIDINAARDAVARDFSMPATASSAGGMRASVSELGMFDASAAARTAVNRALRATEGRRDKAFLEEVAAVYRANPSRPTAAVSEHFGVAHRTAGLYVERARTQQLLEPAKPRARRDATGGTE